MTKDHFNLQIARLKSQWPHGYGEERIKRIWQSFKKIEDPIFTEIIDTALDKMRGSPLVEDLMTIERELVERRHKSRIASELNKYSIQQAFEEAKTSNQRSDPNFVLMCSKTYDDYKSGKLSFAQFNLQCDKLERIAEWIMKKKLKNEPYNLLTDCPELK